MKDLLDNIIWRALFGAQAEHATGTGEARRYAPGFSPIVGFSNPAQPRCDALAPYCEAGEHLYCGGWSAAAPAGWQIDSATTVFQMVCDATAPATDAAPEAVRIGSEHAPQAFELATLTRPGPFGPRTIELGDYLGCFEGGRLIAMAGERMHAGTLRGEAPFLHVISGNTGARGLHAHGVSRAQRDRDPGRLATLK